MSAFNANPAVHVTTGTKWFKQGDAVTISGTVTDHSGTGIRSMTSSIGGTVTVTQVGTTNVYNWISPYNGSDTVGTEITFTATDNTGNTGSDTYTLRVDTVNPVITLNPNPQGYADESAVIWYRQGTSALLSAAAVDQTSGINDNSFLLNGQLYDKSAIVLPTGSEPSAPVSYIFSVRDNAGNANSATFTCSTDGTAPAITVGGFSGSSKYVAVDDAIWFRQGDPTATLSATITDAGSGLRKAVFSGAEYKDGKFTGIQTVAEGCCSTAISAEDNVGNIARSAELEYNVDGTGPALSVAIASRKDQSVITLNAEDAGSGLNSLQYSFDGITYQNYEAPFTMAVDEAIIIKAVDNVGNETVSAKAAAQQILTVTADTETLTASATVSATAIAGAENFAYTTVQNPEKEDWIAYHGEVLTVSEKSTYIFRADFAEGNTAAVKLYTVTFNNIYTEEERSQVIQVAADDEIRLAADDVLTTEKLVLNGNSTFTNDGIAAVAELNVIGSGNVIAGNNIAAGTIKMEEGSSLELNKDQYDLFMAKNRKKEITSFATPEGKLNVSKTKTSDLTQEDIELLQKKENVYDVDFIDQTLNDIHKLTFKAENGKLSIGFDNGRGTSGSDTIRFQKGADITLGSANTESPEEGNYLINLLDGSNKIQIDSQVLRAEILADIGNICEVKIGKEVGSVHLQGLYFSADRNAKLTIDQQSQAEIGNVAATGKKLDIKIGKKSSVTLGNVTCPAKKLTFSLDNESTLIAGSFISGAESDDIKIKKYARAEFKDILLGSGKNKLSIGSCSHISAENISGLNKLELSNGDKQNTSNPTSLNAKDITGTSANDTFKFGDYSSAAAADLSFFDGKNQLTIGKKSVFSADSISFGNGNDTLKIGNESNFKTTGSIDFGDGSNTLTISKDANFNAAGALNFSGSKNKIDVASCSKDSSSTVVLKADEKSAAALNKFSVGKYAEAYLSSELIVRGYALSKSFGKNADIYDIGDFDAAQNFTDIADENSDDDLANARKLLSADYAGWLDDELDTTDFLTNSSEDELSLDLGSGYGNFEITLDGGVNWSAAESSLTLAAGETAGIRLNTAAEGAFAYGKKAQLA